MQKIAVIGMSCLFPGSQTPEQFLHNLNQQVDSTSQHTKLQMGVDPELFYENKKGLPDKYYSKRGGYITNFKFDSSGYDLDAGLLEQLDDIYRWPLHVAKEALKNGGYFNNKEKRKGCGIIFGNLSFPTKLSNLIFLPIYRRAVESLLAELAPGVSLDIQQDLKNASAHLLNSKISGYPAAIVQRALGLSNICFTLDAACASSIYATKLACDYLNTQKADLMLAGAVSAGDPFFINQGFSTFTAYSAKDNCRPLDKSSEGLVSGEGAGMLLLKRLDDAIKDGDTIHAVISAIGLSNDGRGRSVLSPNKRGQILAYERAYKDVDVKPEQVDYIECHATGTQIGDITELESLETFFGRYESVPNIGAVKANFGHLLTCAGMASMLKVILSMSQSEIPATIHVTEPMTSPKGLISGDKIVTKPLNWAPKQSPRYGAVNAFGFGGTNAHLVFEEPGFQSPTKAKSATSNSELAIVGMDACFGPFHDLKSFENAIYKGKSGIGPIPKNRWQGLEQLPQVLKEYGIVDSSTFEGAFIEDFDFASLRYKIPPSEIKAMMPQQLLILKVADNALQDAGIREGANVAVIVAMESDKSLHQFRGRIDFDWLVEKALSDANIDLNPLEKEELVGQIKNAIHGPVQVVEFTSFIGNIMASRIASLWDFSGPAFTISAGDDPVVKALEVAQMMLEENEVEAVVVGAVDLAGNLEDCIIKQFESASQTSSFKTGEGAGAVVLKSKDKAIKDQSNCYAFINSIEKGNSSDEDLLVKIQEQKQPTNQIALIELNGISISETFNELESKQVDRSLISISGVSELIGHTNCASEIASLIKSALVLHHRYLPPNFNNESNSHLPHSNKSIYWPVNQGEPRSATIFSKGENGISKICLQEDITPKYVLTSSFEKEEPFLIPVVAKDSAELLLQLETLQQEIQKVDSLFSFSCKQHSEANRKKEAPFRLSLIGKNKEGLISEIQSAKEEIERTVRDNSEWHSSNGSYFTADPIANEGNLAFVYPGAFNAYVGMGRETYRLFPHLESILETYGSVPFASEHQQWLFPPEFNLLSESGIKQAQSNLDKALVPNFELGISFAILRTALLMGGFGIFPKTAFGYSMGEVSMGFALHLWNSTEQMSKMLRNSPLFKDQLGGSMKVAKKAWGLKRSEDVWSSFVVQMDSIDMQDLLKQHDRVFLLMINTPNQVIIGGESKSCHDLIQKHSLNAVPSAVSNVIHCGLVEAERETIYEMHSSPVNVNKNIRLYSAANYDQTSQIQEQLANNIADIYCKTLDFPKLLNKVYEDGIRVFVEVGPRANCTQWINETLKDKAHLAVAIDNKGMPEALSILKALAKLFSHGVNIDFSLLYPAEKAFVEANKGVMLIETGGKPIREAIVSEDNIAKFRDKLVPRPSSPDISPMEDPIHSTREYPEGDQLPALDLSGERYVFEPSSDVAIQTERKLVEYHSEINRNHASFLTARDAALKHLREMIKLQISLTAGQPVIQAKEESKAQFRGDPYLYPETRKHFAGKESIWKEEDLLEFAEGRIANVFGKEYAVIDSYKYRVRLPMPPYLLVNRVTQLEAVRDEYKPSSMTTEYDVAKDAWFCIDGQVPWAVATEAGQCDLLLISYLGIDFQSKGDRYYRLTDYTMTFFDQLPKAGDTLRYDIKIFSFIRSGEALFFNFGYDCYVDEKHILKMRGGRAGFISEAELAQGKGVVFSREEEKQRASAEKKHFEPLLHCPRSSFTRDDLLNITKGNIAAVFGNPYDQKDLNPSLRFAAEELLMLDRIVSVDRKGGPWGLGEVIGEKDLAPDHWYFPCHFKGDNVLAGTLVMEGCVQLLGFYMLYLGLQVKTRDARFQPIKNRPHTIRARGQIIPSDSKFTYKMEIVELGISPRPFARANFYIIKDDKILVDFRDLGVELLEKSTNDPARANPKV